MGARKSTKFPGVQARESKDKRYKGKPDVCYTIDYRDAEGKRIRKDIGWASQGFSAKLASEMRTRLIHEEKKRAVMGNIAIPSNNAIPTFGDAWVRYKRDWLEANGKKTTSSEGLIRHSLQDLLALPLNQITPYRLDQIMTAMRSAGYQTQTIKHAIGLVRRVMRRMVKWGLYAGPMPFDEIALPKPNNSRERYLTPDEARALLCELKKHSQQTWLVALISLHCGLRFGEIARLRFGDINFDEMSIFIAESKSGRSRYAVMTDEVRDALAMLDAGKKSDLLFPSRTGGIMNQASSAFFRAVDRLKLNGPENDRITDPRRRVVFHTLRHTYASWLAAGGQGQFTIADRLGHHSLEMTKRYTHLMDESRKASAETISKTFHGKPPENQS